MEGLRLRLTPLLGKLVRMAGILILQIIELPAVAAAAAALLPVEPLESAERIGTFSLPLAQVAPAEQELQQLVQPLGL